MLFIAETARESVLSPMPANKAFELGPSDCWNDNLKRASVPRGWWPKG